LAGILANGAARRTIASAAFIEISIAELLLNTRATFFVVNGTILVMECT